MLKFFRGAAILFIVSTLAACAGSVATPVTMQDLPAPEKQAMHVTDVTATAAPGVFISPPELDQLVYKVKAALAVPTQAAVVKASADSMPAVKVELVVTKYDKGNAVARFMLAGLGQIELTADVLFIDERTGQQVGKYEVSKDFAFGGIYGGTTTMDDVEDGFAKSVAAIVKPTG